ncbi:MAG TPA: RcpC/CpaB family pilus assembly protein [Streptosporangiaceae bacterium]
MKRRVLTAGLALLLAALGTVGVLAYVRQANNRAIEGMKAVTVLVAQSGIPSGTTAASALRDGLVAEQRMPASSVPSNALHSLAGLGSLVTSSAIQPGQLLLQPMLVQKAQATGGVAIPVGKLAVTVQLCLPAAVAGYVHAGSQVAVFDTYGDKSLNVKATCAQLGQGQASGAAHTRIVLAKAEVISVGTAPTSSGDVSSSGGTLTGSQSPSADAAVLVTLAVTQADAERVITLDQAGLPYLGLLNSQSGTHFDTLPLPPLFQSPAVSQP